MALKGLDSKFHVLYTLVGLDLLLTNKKDFPKVNEPHMNCSDGSMFSSSET